MPKKNNGRSAIGIFLIVFGVLWLIREYSDFYWLRGDFRFWVIGVLGALFLFMGYYQNRKGLVFWGTVLMLFGAVEIFQDYRIIHPYLTETWPLILMIFGMGFLSTIPLKPANPGAAMPGFILLFIGGFFFLEENYYLPYQLRYYAENLWPIILIAFGAMILWRRPRTQLKEEKPEDVMDTENSVTKV